MPFFRNKKPLICGLLIFGILLTIISAGKLTVTGARYLKQSFGKTDNQLVIEHASGSLLLARESNQKITSITPTKLKISGFKVRGMFDMNGDGTGDLLHQDLGSYLNPATFKLNVAYLWENEVLGSRTVFDKEGFRLAGINPAPDALAAFIFQNLKSGSLHAAKLIEGGIVMDEQPFAEAAGFTVQAVGRFGPDQKSGILVNNSATGEAWILYYQKTWERAPDFDGKNIAFAFDFNGDGREELLENDDGKGVARIGYVSGDHTVRWQDLYLNPTWQITSAFPKNAPSSKGK